MATDNGKLAPNPYTWAKITNMILIDLPVGVGFSYSKSEETVASRLSS